MVSPGGIKIEATVVSGFESVAAEEAIEKLRSLLVCDPGIDRGRIFITLKSAESIHELFLLRAVDRLFVVVYEGSDINTLDGVSCLNDIVNKLMWQVGFDIWARVFVEKASLYGVTSSSFPVYSPINKQDKDPEDHLFCQESNISSPLSSASDPDRFSFRVTCYRTGEHSFTSQEAAAYFGGLINELWHWKVSMVSFCLEVVLNIADNNMYVTFALNKESLHKRNITKFMATTLRLDIAYNMLHMCRIQPFEVVCDPMCGGGSIPLECALAYPNTCILCGDIDNGAVSVAAQNILSNVSKNVSVHRISVCQWDARNLPFRQESVDVFITDLPFGKRVGKRVDNWTLYPDVLKSMAKMAKPNTARACLLSADRRCMIVTLRTIETWWRCVLVRKINMGGLKGFVYLLRRTAAII